MLIVQPKYNFGKIICKELISRSSGLRRWASFELAVAWLNRSGARKIHGSMEDFLVKGGRIRATIGLDFGSTTYEALSTLLDLEESGTNITTHVFHDENPACTFHPKVFLFSNEELARLYVGSNNLTGAGLDTNLEASLHFAGTVSDSTIREAKLILTTWRDSKSDSRTRRLTRALLEQLCERGYVLTESKLRSRRRSEEQSRASKGSPLFGRTRTGTRKGVVEPPLGAQVGDALLMRVRPRRDGSQLQISMLLHASFMQGTAMVIAPDGSSKQIGYNSANGVKNTARFEAPEMMAMGNPVARFWWTLAGTSGPKTNKALHYEIFDASSDPEGVRILQKLESGIPTPVTTDLKRLSNLETVLSKTDKAVAQWYRLDSN